MGRVKMLETGLHVLIAAGFLIWVYIIWPWLYDVHEAVRSRIGLSLDERLERIRQKGRKEASQQRRAKPESWGWQTHERAKAGQHRRERPEPPPRTQPLTERDRHLATLGFSDAPDSSALRKRYRKLAKQWHPDRFAAHASEAKRREAVTRMREINAAYDWLVDNPA